ncbi:MAG: excinuclease ABC subunit B, partial [Firmicutes bacterium]|nr:excinuclease ABC subunit B [Bacillota bacterium]
LMYADTITDSMRRAMDETNRRRELQQEYNERHGITPQTVQKAVRDVIEATRVAEKPEAYLPHEKSVRNMSKTELKTWIRELEERMHAAAKRLEFEEAAELRDLLFEAKMLLDPGSKSVKKDKSKG